MSEFKESIAMIMKAMEAMEQRLKTEMRNEISGVEQRLKTELKNEIKNEISGVEQRIKSELKAEMSSQTNRILSVIESFQKRVEKHERIFTNLKTDIEKD